jgi:hypothetical protein
VKRAKEICFSSSKNMRTVLLLKKSLPSSLAVYSPKMGALSMPAASHTLLSYELALSFGVTYIR